jgi:hypothetical protein
MREWMEMREILNTHSHVTLGDFVQEDALFPNLLLVTVHFTSVVELAEVLVRVLVTTQ